MLPNSAYELVPIVVGTDYSPAASTEDFIDPNTGMAVSPAPSVAGPMTPPIYALLCTKTGTAGNIQIRALGNDSDVTIPCVSFVAGQVYYIYLKQLVNDNSGNVTFVGFRYAAMPQVW